jgi:NADPH:quinone reductase-like Zn-dependent oxidoreductase
MAAAGLDHGAWHAMTGLPYLSRLIFGVRRPKNSVLGTDLAGSVVAVDPEVTRFSVGDEVLGFGRGALAEYALVAEDRPAYKPPGLSFEHAATLPVSEVTAVQAVHDHGHVQERQQVLVAGASGGVGSFAVQLAKAAGAPVTGVCSPGKADYVRSLGADHIVDHTREDFADGSRRYDVIIDIAGNPTLSRLRRPHRARSRRPHRGRGRRLPDRRHERQLRVLLLARFVGQRLTRTRYSSMRPDAAAWPARNGAHRVHQRHRPVSRVDHQDRQ